jgi:hypothetical protein
MHSNLGLYQLQRQRQRLRYSDGTGRDYGDYEPHDTGEWTQLVGFSDYSGSQLDVSNYHALVALCPLLVRADFVREIIGDHGNKGIMCRWKVLELGLELQSDGRYRNLSNGVPHEALLNECHALYETMVALEDYPVIDDEDVSQRQEDKAQEGWNDWQGDSVRADICKIVNADKSESKDTVDLAKLLEWLHEHHMVQGTCDEGSGVNNCSYDISDYDLNKITRDDAKALGFSVIPTIDEASESLAKLLEHDNAEDILRAYMPAIVQRCHPRDLAHAIMRLPSLDREAILGQLGGMVV